jgi:hypothetical protein
MTEAEADRRAVVFARVSWVRWLVAVVWIACSRDVEGWRLLEASVAAVISCVEEDTRVEHVRYPLGENKRPGRCDR